MVFGEIIKEYRIKHHITQQEFADSCRVSKSYISLLESGKSSRSCTPIVPSIDVAKRIASTMGISVDDLIGSMDPSQKLSLAKNSTLIPVLGTVAAGIPIDAVEDILDYEEISAEMAASGKHFGLRIKGASMEPRILEGDVVIVRCQPTIESGEVAIIQVNGNEATCKKVVMHENGLSLVAFNSAAYEPHFYTRSEIGKLPVQVIGKVVELRGKF